MARFSARTFAFSALAVIAAASALIAGSIWASGVTDIFYARAPVVTVASLVLAFVFFGLSRSK